MPIKNDPAVVRQFLTQALQDKELSATEADELLQTLEQDGVTDGETEALVNTLKAALANNGNGVNLDLSTAGRREVVNKFLGQVDRLNPLPVDRGAVDSAASTGSVNWLGLMNLQTQSISTPLAQPSFNGQEVGVDAQGELTNNGARLDMNINEPTEVMMDSLLALNKPGAMEGLSPESRAALTEKLTNTVTEGLNIETESPNKFKRLVSVNASIGALTDVAADWDEGTADSMIAAYDKASTPMMKSLLMRGFDKANLTDAQKATVAGFDKPEHMDELLKGYDSVRNETAKAGWTKIEDGAAGFALKALTFAKKQTSIDNVMDGMKEWKDLNNDYNKPWDSEELSNMNNILETYVESYPQTAYVYGTFSKNAPKEIAKITSNKAVEKAMPELEGANPSLNGFPLSQDQAEYVKGILGNVRDDKAIEELSKGLNLANSMFESNMPSSWGTPDFPDKPMAPASFEMFKKMATSYQDQVEASKDGKLDYKSFNTNMRETVSDIHEKLSPRMAELNGNPPQWDGVELSSDAASYVKETLQNNLRSGMSVDNLGSAVKIVAEANGGKLEGAGYEQLRNIVEDYKGNWEDKQVFDFNKLERIASYAVEGKELPLCTLNGREVGFAQFYNEVASEVAGSIDPSSTRYSWAGERYGMRAKESVELLDVVAEQSLRGEGPVAALREAHPGKEIEILATGRDGGHEQFIYQIKQNGRTVSSYVQDSEGNFGRYNGRTEPVLFSATVGDEGDLNLKVRQNNNVRGKYPLQTTYTVGDKIDMQFRDYSVEEAQEEGEKFTTRSKVVEAEIMSYDTNGNYTVQFTNPANGEVETKELSMREIQDANNPHWFEPTNSYFSDVNIDIDRDEHLKKFLEDAQPIIDQHLPRDGSLLNLSPAELVKRQKACIKAIMDYTSDAMKYPKGKDSNPDAESARYHELVDGYGRFDLGELVKIKKGVCRHQCILEHMLLQQAGIDSRLASGSANTSSGNFRGYHIWTEVSLADDARYLSDQTWNDAMIPLWDGAYDVDKRRNEMYFRTARYDYTRVK